MTISIIIATYNAAATLRRCLDSIVPQLTAETELIVVDGASKDDTNAIIDSYGDKVAVHISEPDKGIYDAWNKGVRAATGDWVMFVGADDELKADALDMYRQFLGTLDTETDLVSSKREMVDLKGQPIRVVGSLWVWPQCIDGMPISHPGALHNRILFSEVGLYNIKYKISADYELLMRKGCRLKAAFMDATTIRVSEGGCSDSYKAILQYFDITSKHPDVSIVKASEAFFVMLTKYTIKKALRFFGVNAHM